MTFPLLYFAYGSNMLTERLAARCSTAEFVGIAALEGHRLTFDKISSDGSGKCGYEECPSASLRGVVWRLGSDERATLDAFEGVGHGYESAKVVVRDRLGGNLTVLTYRATRRAVKLLPYDWYWALVSAGAMQHRLGRDYVDMLRAVPRTQDPVVDRKQRLKAIELLDRAGYLPLLSGGPLGTATQQESV